MRIFTLRAALLAALGATSVTSHADYTVQVGAYAKPDLADRSSAAQVAPVHTLEGPSGLTRILVGRFGSAAQARSALQALRATGYRDAFITRLPGGTSLGNPRPGITRASGSEVPDMRWNHLSDEIREKLVILDGRPHIKEGDSFIPLEKYAAQ